MIENLNNIYKYIYGQCELIEGIEKRRSQNS